MPSRNEIKWMPFNSVISGKKMIDDILKEKNKKIMPTLSEEQLHLIEKELLKAFYCNEKINLKYFQSGNIYTIYDTIKKIDSLYHKIYFSNKVIYFDQIIKII